MASDRAPAWLAATDFSEGAGHAVQRAAMLARQHGGRLELLHVIARGPLDALRAAFHATPQQATQLVEQVRANLAGLANQVAGQGRIGATSRVEVGDVVETIVAECRDAGTLVIGARGTNPLRDWIIGTTAERLLGKCMRPVLVANRPPAEAYARVLVAVDLSDCSEAGLRAALDIAPDAHIVAVHAYDVPFEGKLRLAGVEDETIDRYRAATATKAVAAIDALSERLTGGDRRFTAKVERSHPVRLIREQQKILGADLIVIGKHARSTTEKLLLGSVTRHVLADSSCDVLVVQETP